MPKISIIIPVYNTDKYLPECLDSVLNQTFQDIEIICVDDGSSDASPDILREYMGRDNRIRIIHQENSGVVTARNNAIMAATGEYIYPLDSDDIIAPNALEKLYNAMIHKKGDIITCRVMRFGNQNGQLPLRKPNKFNMAFDNCLVNAALFKKSDFILSGGYSDEFNIMLEDYDLWLNLVFKHKRKIYRVPETLFYYRIKEKSESRNMQNRKHYARVIKQIYNKYPQIKRIQTLYMLMMPLRKIQRFLFRIQNNKIKIFKIPVYNLRKYDTVISVGAACFVPEALKDLNLRKFSGPFDWMWGSDVITRLNLIYNEFADYFNQSDFEYIGENPDNGKLIYKNIRTGIIYNHDFPHGEFNTTFPDVANKYKRRCERMINCLNNDNRILLVFSELGQTGDKNQIIDIIERINNKFAAHIDFLYINHNPNITLGKYTKPRHISKNVIYCEYFYKTFPTETITAKNTVKYLLRKIAK